MVATTVRNLSAEKVAATRIILHLAGIIGAASAGEDWEMEARMLLNPGQANLREGETVSGAFLHSAQADAADIQRLKGMNTEQMCMFLHFILFGTTAVDQPRCAMCKRK